MSGTTLLALLTAALFALSLCPEVDAAAAVSRGRSSADGIKEPQGPLRRIFMKDADASNFFRRRSTRALKSQDEVDAEQRMMLAADERRREFHEEQRSEFENHTEEVNDEQSERSRESAEQWRQWSHYDGTDPPQDYDPHTI